MKKLLLFVVVFFVIKSLQSQLLTWTPDFAKDNDNISITVDATKGNLGLQGFTGNVYVHTGVITSASTGPTDWKYSKFTWATTNPAALATPAGTNKWVYNITGGIRAFYGVPSGETILRIAILFRDGAGNLVQRNADGSDMYVPVYSTNLSARFTVPLMQPFYNPIPEPISKGVGDVFNITAIANNSSNMRLLLNGIQIQTANNVTTISANPTLTLTGNNKVLVEATQGGTIYKDSFSFFVAPSATIAPLPPGVVEGINYNPNNTEITLVLFAPNKNRVSIIGEFAGSNWVETLAYQMNKTPDGKYWWKTITGLTPGTEYAYQYFVDGTIKIGDPYTQKVLDPFNDQYILPATYPGLKPYPVGQSGIVSILQTNEPGYTWTVPGFTRPNKKGLVVYELLLRDFVTNHDFKTLKDSLNYLKNLGVNAIELMPFNEFEGNESWGYNPNYYFAPDKYYGPKNTLKQFIDIAHANGIAVIMDMTMNHVFGSGPQAMLYWDAANNRPAPNNPWLNTVATHPFSVGNDFNHTTNETKYLVDRVVDHWLTEYKIDGFRWDLSKGFTQRLCGDVNCWNQYDLDRVNTWKRIYDYMQSKSLNSYCILEHLGGNDEEKELANYGMMLWGKETDPYNEVSMGYVSNSDFGGVIHNARGWAQPHLVGYAESHDEERTMFKNVTFGNQSGANGYNVRLLSTALRREELIAALMLTIPGPKMFWQFAETGYDYTINYCTNGTINPNCRTDKKPIRWDYLNNTDRRRLYDIYASLNNLRKLKPNAFISGSTQWGTGGLFKWITVNDASLKLVVVANMDVNTHTGTVTFPTSGTYYDYLLTGTFNATGGSQSFTLAPGEYHVYIDQNINGAVFTTVNGANDPVSKMRVLVYPNPVVDNALIEYDLPENGNVEINVLNQNGQVLGNIFKGYKTKGTHNVNFKSNNFKNKQLTGGMYLLQITVNKKKRVEKIFIK